MGVGGAIGTQYYTNSTKTGKALSPLKFTIPEEECNFILKPQRTLK